MSSKRVGPLKGNENLHICLTLILLALPYGKVYQKFRFLFKKGLSKKNSYERRAYESVDEKSLSLAFFRKAMKKRIWED